MPKKIVVIGAGPAGLMAAGTCALCGNDVILIEKNAYPGKKLNITGKGRCNLTNSCDVDTIMQNVPQNPRFLYSAFSSFSAQDTMRFFEEIGVPLKIERGSRVYPVSDKASDVTNALIRWAEKHGAIIKNQTVKKISVKENTVTGVLLSDNKKILCDYVILATGGLSYPATGSTGDGYLMAEELGHTIVSPKPSLVALISEDPVCKELQGLSLKNVALEIKQNKKTIYSDFGEMLFTHNGISGPIILSASAHMPDIEKMEYKAVIDLKPALSEDELNKRILRDFEKNLNKDFLNALDELLPQKMIPVIVRKTGIDDRIKVNNITKEQRKMLLFLLKNFEIPIKSTAGIEEAVITKGGVKVSEINPKTMESKLIHGLYFAGEIIDVDAYTGGFNLQIAWSTGRAAGISSSK